MGTTTVDFLINPLRLKIGDTNPSAYRYLDAWLSTSLLMSVGNLQRYWNYKYLIDPSNNVYRNPGIEFILPEDFGVIQPADQYIIVVMAAIILLEGSLENSAWDAVSWKDNEISFTNSFNVNTRNDNLNRLTNELDNLIKPPSKRLAWTQKSSVPSMKSDWEGGSLDPK